MNDTQNGVECRYRFEDSHGTPLTLKEAAALEPCLEEGDR